MAKLNRRSIMRLLGRSTAALGISMRLSKTAPSQASSNAKTKIREMETDIAVVGAGPGGLSAALHASELGLKVCLFEKSDHTGGARNGGMGPFGAGTHIQEKYGIKGCSQKDAFNYLMNFTHWKVDARLASEYINATPFTVKWLEEKGLIFGPFDAARFGTYMHGFATHPDYKNQDFYACSLLTDRAKAQKNIEILMETPVTKLIKTGNKVTGLVAQDKNGEQIRQNARAVLLMTGGFMGNQEMIKKYTSFTYKKDLFYTYEMPNMNGDGIRMAWEAGAVRAEMMMDIYKGMPIYGGPEGTRMDWTILAKPNLMVNLLGKRFMNEACSDRYFMGNAIHLQPEGRAFMVFDSTIADKYKSQPSDAGSPATAGPALGGFAAPVNDVEKIMAEAKKLKYPYLFAVDSLEDLCKQTGIDLTELKATIAEYNSFCKAGTDPIFYKEKENLLPLNGPKYYAAQFCCDSFGGLGGIKINHKTEVLDAALKPIPGLYAGGSDANTIYAGTYPGYLSGNTTSFAYTTGLIAAKNSTEYIKA
jgi:fumarate reductase flavoprotein subunit